MTSATAQRLVVVGSGVAGTAAVHRALQLGTEVTWVLGASGATVASSGILDSRLPRLVPPRVGLDELKPFAQHMGWHLPEDGALAVTSEGVLREAAGTDAAVLDLKPHVGGRIAVWDAPRPGWEAGRWCESLQAQAASLGHELCFVPLPSRDAEALQTLPWTAPEHDLAAAIEVMLPQIATALKASLAGVADCRALLLGPWCDRTSLVTSELTQRIGLPVGETGSRPFGLAGDRFAASREKLLPRVTSMGGLATRLNAESGKVGVWVAQECIEADRVVLATGGLSGGGVRLSQAGVVGLSLDLEPELSWSLDGQLWLPPRSATGVDVQQLGLSALERLGLQQPNDRAVRVAGDLAAGSPRTMITAALSGIAAVQSS